MKPAKKQVEKPERVRSSPLGGEQEHGGTVSRESIRERVSGPGAVRGTKDFEKNHKIPLTKT
jgi:hypothetical protein